MFESNMNPRLKGALLGLAAFLAFSTHDVVLKVLGATYSPFQVIFFSSLFAFPLVTVLLITDKSADNLRPHHPWLVGLRTLTIATSNLCLIYAYANIPLAQAYAIIFATPLIITILAVPVLGEKVRFYRGAAVVVGLIGVIVVIRPGEADFTLGHAAALLAAFCGAVSSLIVRKIGHEERNVVLLLFPFIGFFLIAGTVMPFVYRPLPMEHLGMQGLAAILSVAGLICMILAYKAAEAALVAPMQYSQIVWATLYGILLFNEFPDTVTVIGAGIIISSGLFIIFRETRANTSANMPVLNARTRMIANLREPSRDDEKIDGHARDDRAMG